MSVVLHEDRAVFEGFCTVEEAEPLLIWLHEHPDAALDLSACQHLHTALVQVLLACGRLSSARPPADPGLASWLAFPSP